MRPLAWVLNLDAELELARPRGYRASARVLAFVRERRAALARFLGPGDAIVEPGVAPGAPLAGHLGAAWCPTPSALAALAAAGVAPPAAPGLEALRRVNHRAFCAELGQTLPGAQYAREPAEVEALVAGPSPSGAWLLKRPYGFVGRGRLRVRAGPLGAAERAWVLASLREGEGLQIEPWVERAGDFALHGWLSPGGAFRLGSPTEQRCDERGAWVESRPAPEGSLEGPERRALLDEGARAAEALARAGYFGPFNLDAFRWKDGRGRPHFNPRCEINARYSMGWALGMGARTLGDFARGPAAGGFVSQ
ncbi:MAG TPA: hypothetical protein VFS43_31080 [Polyangiaceae bacterium]|nr:hypothetical protein [Polyangiaceae bacterium]